MNTKSIAMLAGAALALSGCFCCKNCCDPVMGSWEGDLPLDSMPATSLIFSRGDDGAAKAFVLWRWGSPEWCSDVVVDGASFSAGVLSIPLPTGDTNIHRYTISAGF